MFDIIGILTNAWLGMHAPAPAPAHIVHSAPLVAAPTAAAATTQANASTIVDNVQKFYAGIKQVTAQFRQTVTNATFGSTKKSDGTVWLMKPGKMRWDYLEKKQGTTQVQKSFISNGTYLYVVEHNNKQVVKRVCRTI